MFNRIIISVWNSNTIDRRTSRILAFMRLAFRIFKSSLVANRLSLERRELEKEFIRKLMKLVSKILNLVLIMARKFCGKKFLKEIVELG